MVRCIRRYRSMFLSISLHWSHMATPFQAGANRATCHHITLTGLFGFNGDSEHCPDSCETRLASACHSIAISVHASRIAGSVASRANTSLASALTRYLSETLIMVMLHVLWREHNTLCHRKLPNHRGDAKPTLPVVICSIFVSNIAHTVVLR